MEPKYKINPLTGELQEYVFEYNGILVLRNFTAQVDNDRLVVRSASDVNFSILEALVSEVEIDGVLYDNPTAAKEALQRLVFNKNVPVILPEEERKKISSALQSGGYSGTAQDLKKLIERSSAELSEAFKKAVGNLQIGGRNYLLNSKQTLITSSVSAITGVIGVSPDFKKILNEQPTLPIVISCYIRYKNITSTEPKSRLGFEGAISFTDDTSQYFNYWLNVSADDIGKSIKGQRFYSVFTLLPNKTIKDVVVSGIFSQITAEEVEISNPKIEFGDIPTDWSPAPEDLALYEDLIKVGSLITGNVSLNKNHRNLIFFVTANANIDVKGLGDLGSSSFRKVFNEGVVTFTCESKNIIYTGDNTFNGKKGSTAVVSIYDNDCYIDIRNI
nr:MAG TPA: hypothetical protein [Caudoviricetes sp.]